MDETNSTNSLMNEPDPVGIILLNWNNYEDTSRCIRSLDNIYYPYELILVDNGSTDGSVEKLKSEFEFSEIMELEENRGFAKGMNAGIQTAIDKTLKHVLISNNDIIFNEYTISSLVETLESNKKIAGVSPIIKYNNKDEVWFEAGEIDWKKGKAKHTTLESQEYRNDYLPLTCALFDTQALSEVDLIPTQYFLYYEDVELGINLRESGYRLATDSDSIVYHRESSSTGHGLGTIRTYYSTRNRIVFLRQNQSGILHYTILIKLLIYSLVRFLYRIVNLRLSSARALLEGLFDGIKMKTGKGPYP